VAAAGAVAAGVSAANAPAAGAASATTLIVEAIAARRRGVDIMMSVLS
jgi:hypothetical protein